MLSHRLISRLERSWPSASLRSYLFAMILVATLPMAVHMALQGWSDVRNQQAQTDRELERSASGLADEVERELRSSLDGLNVLAQSELFQHGRIAAMGRLLHGSPRGDWDSVFLLDRDGAVVLDTAPQPARGTGAQALRDLQRQAAGGRAAISGMWDGQRPASRAIAVAVPIMQNGQLRYVLGARMGQAVWQRLAADVATPPGARGEVFDAQDRLMGMSGVAQPPAGAMLPRDAADEMEGQPAGVHRAGDIDGRTVYAAWHTIPLSGWRVQVSVPAGPIDAAHRRTMLAALSTGSASLLFGLLLAALVGHRVARPIRLLASGGAASLPDHVCVREIETLREALRQPRGEVQQHSTAAGQDWRGTQRQIERAQEAGGVGFFEYRFGVDRLTWSAGHCRLFGVEALAGGTLRDWFDAIVPADRERVEREFWTACAVRREQAAFDYAIARPDGRRRWLSSRCVLQYDADGRASELAGVTVDVTDQLEAERSQLSERAAAAQAEAQTANRSREEFLKMLNHELRNPVGAITAAIGVLESAEPGSATAEEARTIIARQTRQLSSMMNDLLDAARVIAGTVVLAREPVNLAAVGQRVRDSLALTGDSTEHPLEFDLHDAWVEADAARIEQVISRLVATASKSTAAGQPVRVRTAMDGDTAVAEVHGERALDRPPGRLAIGLTLVRRLSELHGGTVTVDSSGRGSRLTVRLPAIGAPQPLADQAAPPSRRRHVLVIEDNADVMAALRAKLELEGHTVSAASDGTEGLDRLLNLRPDVSIVDIGLPGLTGFELARHARAAGYAGRMIAISGYAAEGDAREALVAGFDAYLVEPVDRNQLRATLSAD